MKKVFIVEALGSGHGSVARMFVSHNWAVTHELEDADLVQFCGGSDINPSLYNQNVHKTTDYDQNRDNKEQKIFTQAQELGIPCAGICRGGQFLHVMNEGELWQDVNNHMGRHDVTMYGKLLPIEVSSDHHQMMALNTNTRSRAFILMFVEELATYKTKMSENMGSGAVYPISRNVNSSNRDEDIEALWYPDTNCLCFQPHPEYAGYKDCEDAYFHFLNNYTFADDDTPFSTTTTKEICPDCKKQSDFCDC